MRKPYFIFIISVFQTFVFLSSAFGLGCGNCIIEKGDFKHEVLRCCGNPMSKEVIGYKLNKYGNRELKVEQWVYGPWKGYYYVLVFEGGKIVEIIMDKKM